MSTGIANTLEASLRHAAQLAAALAAGQTPPPIASPIALLHGERLFSHAQVQILEYSERDVYYNTGGLVAFGGPFSLAASLGASALYNSHKRRQAERQAASQWRFLDQGLTYLTSSRFACQLSQRWADIGYASIRMSQCDEQGVTLWIGNAPPTRLVLPAPHWYFVLFRYLAYGEVVDVPAPPPPPRALPGPPDPQTSEGPEDWWKRK